MNALPCHEKTTFFKYSGAGNTFLIGDVSLPIQDISSLCTSYKVDGIITFKKISHLHFQMFIFNRDGSEAEMCGNGLRCLIDHLTQIEKVSLKSLFIIETKAGVHEGWKENEGVSLLLPLPHSYIPELEIKVEDQIFRGSFVNSGVPHFVIFENEERVEEIGRAIRFHPRFAPEGTNVNFVQIEPPSTLFLRTYERGVEGETLACGTGAIASSYISMRKFSLKSPFQVKVRSGETLAIHFTDENVTMKGRSEQIDSFVIGYN